MASFDFDMVETSLLQEESKTRKSAGSGKAPIGWSAHKTSGPVRSSPVLDRAAGGGAEAPSIPFVLDQGFLWVQKRSGTVYTVTEPTDQVIFTR
eukprot:CAMPEP_0197871740 /NCGR_PEP_ID=MMETSP1439-20131203/2056_1 /TAXON_ID=66791 /ORGANISM="Gonyaulax spinifera, Strain CCMP409" /LENGTH=93 /DNA_ID=CAMNT_0043490693 /DNA_START=80 /DNA_END=361 /DNA_ORIENTATION=-